MIAILEWALWLGAVGTPALIAALLAETDKEGKPAKLPKNHIHRANLLY
jgi:hypothetical protein